MSKLYADRDAYELGHFYLRHVEAMTAEGLHSKADIAAELGYRDRRIAELERELTAAREQARQAAIADVVSTIKENASGSAVDVVIAMIERLATLPPSHVVVPVEPTPLMKQAAVKSRYGNAVYKCVEGKLLAQYEDEAIDEYKAMIASKP